MNERETKIYNLMRQLASGPEMELVKRALYDSGFGVRKQIETTPLVSASDPEREAQARVGILLDVETTGLDPEADKIIQLSMYRALYDSVGIIRLDRFFNQYQDPGFPIPDEITRVTGITDEMVAGRNIDPAEVAEFLSGADRSIAHHANFDRRFCEKAFPDVGFENMAWDCSIEQVDWAARGEKSPKLELLVAHLGFVYAAHSADSDIQALARILNSYEHEGKTAFAEMLERSRISHMHLFAHGASFHKKDLLKENGYRWAAADSPVEGQATVWHKYLEANEEALERERDLLREVFGGDTSIMAIETGPLDRYSVRKTHTRFLTKKPESALEEMGMSQRLPTYDQSTFGF